MSFLYRAALTVTRKQPYLDWANSLDDGGPDLTAQLARDRRTIYLVPESDTEADPQVVVEDFWAAIFEDELNAWSMDETTWPDPLTREMFDAWFEIELTGSVCDLTPEEPLTQADAETLDLVDAVRRCAWCDIDVDEGAGRFVAFKLADRSRLAHREGLVVSLLVDDEHVAMGIMSRADSAEAREGEDVIFRACTSRCEKALRRAVPKALRKELGT